MFVQDIKKLTKENTYFRKVLHTGINSQLVAMNIPVNSDIGSEVHSSTDQIIFIVEGKCNAQVNGETQQINEHSVVFVPAGKTHNFTNIGNDDLKLYTIYAPAEHPDGTIHKTKNEALKKDH